MQQTTTSNLISTTAGFMSQVYGWMTAGLLVTTLVSLVITSNTQLLVWIYTNEGVLPIVLILELVLVIGLSSLINKINPLVAGALFILYSAMNGLFFAVLINTYTPASVFTTFAATAGTFFLMSLYGFVTKADLTRWGSLALMALLGLIIGLVINLFLQSTGLDWFLTFVGIGIFIILIAYDTQKLKKYAEVAQEEGNISKFAIMGALALYLDFINLFIRLLAIFGNRRR